jgi:hypothetical protein
MEAVVKKLLEDQSSKNLSKEPITPFTKTSTMAF